MPIITLVWEEMDFGSVEYPLCGICGHHDRFPFSWDDEGQLIEDCICDDCDSKYEYDPETDEYKKRKLQAKQNPSKK